MRKESKNILVKDLRSKGWTYKKIGDFLGISKQEVYNIIHYVPHPRLPRIPRPSGPKIRGKLEGRDFLKEKVRMRDNHTCQNCGQIWIPGTRRFDTHHKNFVPSQTEAREYKNNKNMDDMITLCHKCQMNLPEHRKAMKEKPFMWEYVIPARINYRLKPIINQINL